MQSFLLVVEIEEIFDHELYGRYIREVINIIKSHNGQYIARSDKIHTVAGQKPQRCIIIGFDSKEQIDNFLQSDEYRKIKPLRENNTKSKAFIVENS